MVVGDKMYVFGGSSSSDETDDATEYHNDLYTLHCKDEQWRGGRGRGREWDNLGTVPT